MTAILTDSVGIDELVSVKLHFEPHASDDVFRVGRTLMMISECTERLRKLYGNLVDTIPLAMVIWPNPTADPPESIEGTLELIPS